MLVVCGAAVGAVSGGSEPRPISHTERATMSTPATAIAASSWRRCETARVWGSRLMKSAAAPWDSAPPSSVRGGGSSRSSRGATGAKGRGRVGAALAAAAKSPAVG